MVPKYLLFGIRECPSSNVIDPRAKEIELAPTKRNFKRFFFFFPFLLPWERKKLMNSICDIRERISNEICFYRGCMEEIQRGGGMSQRALGGGEG